MNTQNELDRVIRDWLDDRVAEPRQAGLDAILDRTTTTPQHRRRLLERWLRRGTSATRSARARGSPPDIDDSRRNRIMLSATGIVGTIVVLALAATLVLPADRVQTPIGPGAGTGATHVVAQDGTGEFATVTDAVEASVDGDVVLVKPGRYIETVTITKDITLAGDGPRDEVVIENPPDGPVADHEILREWGPLPHFTLLVEDADATISGLTVSGPKTGGITAIVIGGQSTLDDISVVLDGPSGTWDAWAALYVLGSSRVDVRGSELNGWVDVSGGSSTTFEQVVFAGHLHVEGPGGASIRGNTFVPNLGTGNSGMDLADEATGTIEGNDVTAGPIEIASGSDVEIRDNVVGGTGISVMDEGTTAVITGNTVSSNQRGIDVGVAADATIEGNTITGGLAGLFLASDAVLAKGNTITGARNGIIVAGDATPTITGNTLCDNGADLLVDDGNPTTLEGNEVCAPDASPAASG